MILLKLRIRIKIEQTKPETEHIQFDIGKLRGRPALLQTTHTIQKMHKFPRTEICAQMQEGGNSIPGLSHGVPRHGATFLHN